MILLLLPTPLEQRESERVKGGKKGRKVEKKGWSRRKEKD